MENFNNDDVKKMLEMLKEQAESTNNTSNIDTQTTDTSTSSDDDIKDMLKKHFSSDNSDSSSTVIADDYSFDGIEDFISEQAEESIKKEKNKDDVTVEEIPDENSQFSFEVEKIPDEQTAFEESATEVESSIEIDEESKEPEEIEEAKEEQLEKAIVLDSSDVFAAQENDFDVEEDDDYFEDKGAHTYIQNSDDLSETTNYDDEEEPVAEESINYDEVLEGQQGTVFNQFVEDFTGELDDVVFEAEITESHAPDKQYTIFEDWQQIINDKDYATAEEEIVPPSNCEFDHSNEITDNKNGKTDYFKPIVSNDDLDAVDIALMVALGGESELNETVGFEKIRQAVHDVKEEEETELEDKKVYGCSGDEYSSLVQNIKIKKKYKSDKAWVVSQTIATGLLALALLIYEIIGWVNTESFGATGVNAYTNVNIWLGIALLTVCFALSINKLVRLIKEPLSVSSLSYLGALITMLFSVLHDVLIIVLDKYASPGMLFHSVSAVLLFISLVYDLFDVIQQSYMFNIVSLNDKKLVFEPYGKIKTDDDSEMIESDSYCISRVPTVKKYFERTARSSPASMSKLVPLVLSFSIAICVALLVLLIDQNVQISLFSFIITLSFLLVCTCIFESEFAFFVVHKILKKYKTGIIGKSSVAEYGKTKVVYFDDFNVFNKKSVRTKGLKLYDNNEIYRILYHTQAVFSKVGGPLKGVFEFATTEMTHSKKVEIKEISQEGISAIVDGRTSVLIGTGAFMRSRYIHPSYTSADLKLEESGEESIMFIALNGVLGAKLYVTYQFSAEFEKLARKLCARGVNIGIRSADPNVNTKWAKKYGDMKRCPISIVRPTLKEIKPSEKSIESGIVSIKNVRALSEALIMCIKLNSLEALMGKVRTVALVLMGILSFALVLIPNPSAINIMTILALTLASAVCTSIMALLTYFYIKN